MPTRAQPRPIEFQLTFPGMHWKSLLVAAFAVYEEARRAPTPARRDALIAMGNNYVAWREQHDMAQPVFTPSPSRPDEVSRAALLEALTPLLTTDFGLPPAHRPLGHAGTRGGPGGDTGRPLSPSA